MADDYPLPDWTTNQPDWERYLVPICPGLYLEGTRRSVEIVPSNNTAEFGSPTTREGGT